MISSKVVTLSGPAQVDPRSGGATSGPAARSVDTQVVGPRSVADTRIASVSDLVNTVTRNAALVEESAKSSWPEGKMSYEAYQDLQGYIKGLKLPASVMQDPSLWPCVQALWANLKAKVLYERSLKVRDALAKGVQMRLNIAKQKRQGAPEIVRQAAKVDYAWTLSYLRLLTSQYSPQPGGKNPVPLGKIVDAPKIDAATTVEFYLNDILKLPSASAEFDKKTSQMTKWFSRPFEELGMNVVEIDFGRFESMNQWYAKTDVDGGLPELNKQLDAINDARSQLNILLGKKFTPPHLVPEKGQKQTFVVLPYLRNQLFEVEWGDKDLSYRESWPISGGQGIPEMLGAPGWETYNLQSVLNKMGEPSHTGNFRDAVKDEAWIPVSPGAQAAMGKSWLGQAFNNAMGPAQSPVFGKLLTGTGENTLSKENSWFGYITAIYGSEAFANLKDFYNTTGPNLSTKMPKDLLGRTFAYTGPGTAGTFKSWAAGSVPQEYRCDDFYDYFNVFGHWFLSDKQLGCGNYPVIGSGMQPFEWLVARGVETEAAVAYLIRRAALLHPIAMGGYKNKTAAQNDTDFFYDAAYVIPPNMVQQDWLGDYLSTFELGKAPDPLGKDGLANYVIDRLKNHKFWKDKENWDSPQFWLGDTRPHLETSLPVATVVKEHGVGYLQTAKAIAGMYAGEVVFTGLKLLQACKGLPDGVEKALKAKLIIEIAAAFAKKDAEAADALLGLMTTLTDEAGLSADEVSTLKGLIDDLQDEYDDAYTAMLDAFHAGDEAAKTAALAKMNALRGKLTNARSKRINAAEEQIDKSRSGTRTGMDSDARRNSSRQERADSTSKRGLVITVTDKDGRTTEVKVDASDQARTFVNDAKKLNEKTKKGLQKNLKTIKENLERSQKSLGESGLGLWTTLPEAYTTPGGLGDVLDETIDEETEAGFPWFLLIGLGLGATGAAPVAVAAGVASLDLFKGDKK